MSSMLNDPTGLMYRFFPEEKDPSWREYAECKGTDPNLFFPERGDQENVRFVIENFCSVCPVEKECLEFGKSQDHGIWGGKAGKELRTIRSGRERRDSFVKHGTVTGYNNHLHKNETPCKWCSAAYYEDTHRRNQVV